MHTLLLWMGLLSASKAPTFSLKDLQNNTHTLQDYLKQGPVLLNFWATWCTFCDKELDEYQTYWARNQDRFTLVAISWDTPRTLSRVRSMARAHGWTFPILLDDSRKVGRAYGVFGLPVTYLIAPDGSIVGRWIGYHAQNLREIRTRVDSLVPLSIDSSSGEGQP
jgi:peroxiredoxin